MNTSKLTPKEQCYLKAAEGWLELGDEITAFEELEKIAPLRRAEPEVLKLRWQAALALQPWFSNIRAAT